VSAQGPTFVPQAAVASLIEPLPRPDLVTLGPSTRPALLGLRPRGGRRIATLYAVPTSDGVALVSCSVPTGDPAAVRRLARCEQVAATLEIRGAQPVELVFSAEYGEVLTGVLSRLNKVRATERENLRFRGRQPEAARALALAYAEAGRKLAATDPPADAAMHEDIRRAFRRPVRPTPGSRPLPAGGIGSATSGPADRERRRARHPRGPPSAQHAGLRPG
jgi:hypothetical protein